MKFSISQPKMVWLPQNEKYNHWFWLLTLVMTLTLNFPCQILKQQYIRNRRANWHWTKGGHSWPWPCPFGDQDVRIYQIVTRVTSDVSVLSTRLVLSVNIWGLVNPLLSLAVSGIVHQTLWPILITTPSNWWVIELSIPATSDFSVGGQISMG